MVHVKSAMLHLKYGERLLSCGRAISSQFRDVTDADLDGRVACLVVGSCNYVNAHALCQCIRRMSPVSSLQRDQCDVHSSEQCGRECA